MKSIWLKWRRKRQRLKKSVSAAKYRKPIIELTAKALIQQPGGESSFQRKQRRKTKENWRHRGGWCSPHYPCTLAWRCAKKLLQLSMAVAASVIWHAAKYVASINIKIISAMANSHTAAVLDANL